MGIVVKVLFLISGAIMTLCFLLGMEGGGVSWEEAALGIVPCMFFCLLFGLLSVILTPAKYKNDPYQKKVYRRGYSIKLGLFCWLYCLILGSVTTLYCHSEVKSLSNRYYSSYSSSYDNDRYADLRKKRNAKLGRAFGISLAAQSVLPFGLFIVGLVRKPKQEAGPYQAQGIPDRQELR